MKIKLPKVGDRIHVVWMDSSTGNFRGGCCDITVEKFEDFGRVYGIEKKPHQIKIHHSRPLSGPDPHNEVSSTIWVPSIIELHIWPKK